MCELQNTTSFHFFSPYFLQLLFEERKKKFLLFRNLK